MVLDAAPVPDGDGWRCYVTDDESGGNLRPVSLNAEQIEEVEVLVEDGGADSAEVLAALWAAWMGQVASSSKAAAVETSALVPYPHQNHAVYQVMLPQPRLRFLLADEPGTGKTVMGGLWLREAQRLGFVKRALIVAPAHLVTKWQADYERFLGAELRRITSQTVAPDGNGSCDLDVHLQAGHNNWIVSADLAAANQAVYETIHPGRIGWDAVVIDEAHRMTPTAKRLFRVAKMLSKNTPQALLMTATPHRGDEWLFRSLMYLVDPEVFSEIDDPDRELGDARLRPSMLHFLRRMKEDLVGYDGTSKLFLDREAANIKVALNATERAYYEEAQELVERYFPTSAQPLAKMVYGKRAASSLFALAETLRRRVDAMDTANPSDAAREADPDDDDEAGADEARVIVERSQASGAERKELTDMLDRLERDLTEVGHAVSKWPRVENECLHRHGVTPDTDRQVVVFTEFADTADWLVGRFEEAGFAVARYSGRDSHDQRDKIRMRFANREFQVLISTDAGNEGIDLQTAQVLVNWDIPWSLVRLEQRMGRIHRVGQTGKVWLYNVIATDTREGDALSRLLDRLVAAANELGGKMFDSLSLVGNEVLDQCGVGNGDGGSRRGDRLTGLLRRTYEPGGEEQVDRAIGLITDAKLHQAHHSHSRASKALSSPVDIAAAMDAWHYERLERVTPHVVERFLDRVHKTGLLTVEIAAVHDYGFRYLSRPLSNPRGGGGLPVALRPDPNENSVLVATSGEAKRSARAAGQARAARAVALGPGEPTFRELVENLYRELRPALYRGGSLRDPTASCDYELHVCEVDITGGPGQGARTLAQGPAPHSSTRSYLIRVDTAGARSVAWEALANLEVSVVSGGSEGSEGAGPYSPGGTTEALEAARLAVDGDISALRAAWAAWLNQARRQLRRLPNDLTDHLSDPVRRVAERERIEGATSARIEQLEAMASVEASPVHRVGWARVEAGLDSAETEDPDSELVATHRVINLLRSDGWGVHDVHSDGRGYDLYATKDHRHRCVEVKGIAGRAPSQGIRLTGNELLMAAQHDDDYWLYVVDRCAEGGEFFAAYQNPAKVFSDRFHDQPIVRIRGSDLQTARHLVSDAVASDESA